MQICASDDPTYLKPMDGEVDFELPERVRQRGHINKLEFVIGSGEIKDFVIGCRFS